MNPPADTEPPASRIGGRYVLNERIGVGAMGAVWRGTDELLNRTVAVKELLATVPPGGANGEGLEEARQRLQREGRLGARLQHPHVISVFDVVLHDDRPWLVMEYLPSRSLATVLAEGGPLPAREVAEIGRQVADGLAAAHAAGVVHRDVKPGNVLLAEDGRVKLTDFGVSRAVDDVQVTRTGLIAGTPAFLAPEVARGREPTASSDVFALGATLYAAVEGHPPFGLDENAYALLHKVATGAVDPPHQAGPLTNLLMRLLASEPGDRPSAAQARDALAAIASGATSPLDPSPGDTAFLAAPAPQRRVVPAPPLASPPTLGAAPVPPRPPSGRPRRMSPVVLAVLGALLVAGATGAVLLLGGAPDQQPPVAPAPSTTLPSTTRAPAAAAPSTTTTTRAAPSTTAAPQPQPAADPVAFVEQYYALLPEDTDAAWKMLSPQAQSASGGRASFENFYRRFDNVDVRDAEQTGDGTAEATVVFDPRDGAPTRERYRFVVGDEDGEPVMESFSHLG